MPTPFSLQQAQTAFLALLFKKQVYPEPDAKAWVTYQP